MRRRIELSIHGKLYFVLVIFVGMNLSIAAVTSDLKLTLTCGYGQMKGMCLFIALVGLSEGKRIVAIQVAKLDSSISASELLPESYQYSVYRKDRTLDGGGVMLLIHKDISDMPITELESNSESVWVKVLENKTSHFVASWYRPPGGGFNKT